MTTLRRVLLGVLLSLLMTGPGLLSAPTMALSMALAPSPVMAMDGGMDEGDGAGAPGGPCHDGSCAAAPDAASVQPCGAADGAGCPFGLSLPAALPERSQPAAPALCEPARWSASAHAPVAHGLSLDPPPPRSSRVPHS